MQVSRIPLQWVGSLERPAAAARGLEQSRPGGNANYAIFRRSLLCLRDRIHRYDLGSKPGSAATEGGQILPAQPVTVTRQVGGISTRARVDDCRGAHLACDRFGVRIWIGEDSFSLVESTSTDGRPAAAMDSVRDRIILTNNPRGPASTVLPLNPVWDLALNAGSSQQNPPAVLETVSKFVQALECDGMKPAPRAGSIWMGSGPPPRAADHQAGGGGGSAGKQLCSQPATTAFHIRTVLNDSMLPFLKDYRGALSAKLDNSFQVPSEQVSELQGWLNGQKPLEQSHDGIFAQLG